MGDRGEVSRAQPDEARLRESILARVDDKILSSGELSFPCIPSLLDVTVAKLVTCWNTLGRSLSASGIEQLTQIVDRGLKAGFAASAHARLEVTYRAQPPPGASLQYQVQVRMETLAAQYQKWIAQREPPFFGSTPDAKVLSVAAGLAQTQRGGATLRVLDVGAGTGRNAVALAKLGHAVHAVELVPELCAQLSGYALREHAGVTVTEGDILDDAVTLPAHEYQLVVLSEVLSHFRDVGEVRRAATKLAAALAPGGIVLLSVFLAQDGYEPDALARETSQAALSSLFTRQELSFMDSELSLTLLSDVSAYEFEKARLLADAWPPTPWFPAWSRGHDVFDLPAGEAPVELRWLAYQRR